MSTIKKQIIDNWTLTNMSELGNTIINNEQKIEHATSSIACSLI